MEIEKLKLIAILVQDAYEDGALNFVPKTHYEPVYRHTPQVHCYTKYFIELFASNTKYKIERVEDETGGYEYQVDVDGVLFFCMTRDIIKALES